MGTFSWPRTGRGRERRKKREGEKDGRRGKERGTSAAARWPVKVGQGRGEPREERRKGGGGGVLRSGTTDVIFIPGPGRGQRGHQRTGDE